MKATPLVTNPPTVEAQARLLNALLNVLDGLNDQLLAETVDEKRDFIFKHIQQSLQRATPFITEFATHRQSSLLAKESLTKQASLLTLSSETICAICQTLLTHAVKAHAHNSEKSLEQWRQAIKLFSLLQTAASTVENLLARQIAAILQTLMRELTPIPHQEKIDVLRPHYWSLRALLRSAYTQTKRWAQVVELNKLNFELATTGGFPLTAARDLTPLEISALKMPSIVYYEINRVFDAFFYVEFDHDHYPVMLQSMVWFFYAGLHRQSEQLHITLHQLLDNLHTDYSNQCAQAPSFTLPAKFAETMQTLADLIEGGGPSNADILDHIGQVMRQYEVLVEYSAMARNKHAHRLINETYLFLKSRLSTPITTALHGIDNDINYYLRAFHQRTQLDATTTKLFFERTLEYSDLFRQLIVNAPNLSASTVQPLEQVIEMAHTYWLHLEFQKAERLYLSTKLSPYMEITCAGLGITQANHALLFLERFMQLHLAGDNNSSALFLSFLESLNTPLVECFSLAVSHLIQATHYYTSVNLSHYAFNPRQLSVIQPFPQALRKILVGLDHFLRTMGTEPVWLGQNPGHISLWLIAIAKLDPLQTLLRFEEANTAATPSTPKPATSMAADSSPPISDPVTAATPESVVDSVPPAPPKKKKKSKKKKKTDHGADAVADADKPQDIPTEEPLDTPEEVQLDDTALADIEADPSPTEVIAVSPNATHSSLSTDQPSFDLSETISPPESLCSSETCALSLDSEANTAITTPSPTPSTEAMMPPIDRQRFLPGSGQTLTREECLAILEEANRDKPITVLLSYSFQCQLTAIAGYVNEAVRHYRQPDYALCAGLRPILKNPKQNPWLLRRLVLATPYCPDHRALIHDTQTLFPLLWLAALGLQSSHPLHPAILERCARACLQPNPDHPSPLPQSEAYGLLLFGLHALLFTHHPSQFTQADRWLADAQRLFGNNPHQGFWQQTAAELRIVSQSRRLSAP